MIKMRAKKTTRNADDFRVLVAGIVCTIMILMGSVILPRFTEQRWYRDLTNLTPFHSVELLYSNVSEDSISIQFGGSLVKRRCEFNNLIGYIYGDNGLRYFVPVDTSSEGSLGNRPPSSVSESWGPWIISTESNPNIPNTVLPVRWEVIAEHIKCPTPPKVQRNLFVEGAWEDFALLVNEEIALEVLEIEGEAK